MASETDFAFDDLGNSMKNNYETESNNAVGTSLMDIYEWQDDDISKSIEVLGTSLIDKLGSSLQEDRSKRHDDSDTSITEEHITFQEDNVTKKDNVDAFGSSITSTKPTDSNSCFLNIQMENPSFTERTKKMSPKKETILVAAIDLGTNYSGCAFSFKHEYANDPPNVSALLACASGNCVQVRQPTSVLCNPDGVFDSFGYEAENKYSALLEDKKHHKWYFFRRFKLMLYEKQVNMGFELADEKGLKMPAITVVAIAIRYFKNELLQSLQIHGTGLRVNDIHWVLPVPTTWTVSAKDFLREAANEAGIEGSLLTIVPEAVAATMFCELLCPRYCPNWITFVDTKYIVTDLGDERISTTVLENKLDGTIKVVYTNSDRSIGSTKVDEAFIQMIIEIFGSQTFKKFCDENEYDFMALLRDFGDRKRRIRTVSKSNVALRLPQALEYMYEETHKDQVKDARERSRYREKIVVIGHEMRFDADLFRSLFENTISNITKHIANVLERTDVKGTKALVMVGTFFECELIQDAMKKALPRIDVCIPQDGNFAVMKGAIFFGHQSRAIDDDDVSCDDIVNQSTCSSSYVQGVRNDQIGNLKYGSLNEEGEEFFSSDYLEMTTQREDKSTQALETQLENQMTLKVDIKRAPSDDELFILSRKLDKFKNNWWLLAKLLGLSDEKIDELEHGGGDTIRQYYKMLTAWKRQNAGQENGSVGYLLRQCGEAGIDREVTDTVFGN